MDLNIFIVLSSTLFAGGYSLKCNGCNTNTSSCVSIQTTCLTTYNTCASASLVATVDGNTFATKFKGCYLAKDCGNGSVNLGVLRSAVSMQCCNTDLCNTQDISDSNTNTPNGKQCYSCDGNSCINKLNCLGTEDYCVTATTNISSLPLTLPSTMKGCISKSVCDSASQVTEGLSSLSCCQGNLCNSAKSVTQSFVFLSWPFLFYILFH